MIARPLFSPEDLIRINTPKAGFFGPAFLTVNIDPAPDGIAFQEPSDNGHFGLIDHLARRVRRAAKLRHVSRDQHRSHANDKA